MLIDYRNKEKSMRKQSNHNGAEKTESGEPPFFLLNRNASSIILGFIAILIAVNAFRMLMYRRIAAYDIGMLMIAAGGISLVISMMITAAWHTRREILAATVLGIIPAVLYPAGIVLILIHAELSATWIVFGAAGLAAVWAALSVSAVQRCRLAMEVLKDIGMTAAGAQAEKDIAAAESSGAANIDERIALALIAADEKFSGRPELAWEYHKKLSGHAEKKGHGGSFYADIAKELIGSGKVKK